MLTRILAVTLAAGSLTFATAHAQTGTGMPGSNQSRQQMAPSPETTKPSTVPTTAQTTGTPGSGSVGSGPFDPSQYRTKTDCLNAASAAQASFSLCNGLK
jgi:hypothetical protein